MEQQGNHWDGQLHFTMKYAVRLEQMEKSKSCAQQVQTNDRVVLSRSVSGAIVSALCDSMSVYSAPMLSQGRRMVVHCNPKLIPADSTRPIRMSRSFVCCSDYVSHFYSQVAFLATVGNLVLAWKVCQVQLSGFTCI